MNSSLIIAMNSMQSYQNKIDTIADNTANVDTVGYKRKIASFADLLNNTTEQPEDFLKDGRVTPLGFTQGWGAKIASMLTDFQQGSLQSTGQWTDLAIEGYALFEVQADNQGTLAYTRDGSFEVSINGEGQAILTTSQGMPVRATLEDGSQGSIVVPNGYTVQIGQDGTVLASNNEETLNLGRLNLVTPVRPDMLTQVSNNLFAVAEGVNAEEVVQRVLAGNNNGISISQGYLEKSNVDLTTELTDLVRAQRAYQLAARALSSSDTLMQISNNLRS
jgi:flagellar basal-body rod protein FlgG